MECRKGEQEKTWFRSDRVQNISGKWYFCIREGGDVGPFPSRDAATRELGVFLKQLDKGGLLAAQYAVKLGTQAKY